MYKLLGKNNEITKTRECQTHPNSLNITDGDCHGKEQTVLNHISLISHQTHHNKTRLVTNEIHNMENNIFSSKVVINFTHLYNLDEEYGFEIQ